MGLRLIIGPAGSGKTRYIVNSVIDALLEATGAEGKTGQPDSVPGPAGALSRPPVLIVVPDQATFQMEKAILEDARISGFINLHVLGFRRLCMRVLDEVGGVTQPFITPVGRSMAIQSILWEHRGELSVYAPMVDYPGFRDAVIQALSEFNAYDVNPHDLETRAKEQTGTPPFLSQKLRDLELIYSKYREFLQDNFLDPDDYLELAASRIPRSNLVQDATVWIDGFSGFTPKEYKVISSILKTAGQVNLALCMDREEIQHRPTETSLFHPVREVYEKVLKTCRDDGVFVEDAIIFGEKRALPRFKSLELAWIESAFRNKERRPWEAFESADGGGNLAHGCHGLPPGGVHLVSAVNPRAEVEFAAREIRKLVREDGFRYRDITVELRNLGKYKDLIEMVFRDHDIPFFLDLKRPLSHHPLAELIRSAFDMLLTDFGFDPVFRYLKTDLVPLERESVDELENYVLACGIRGRRWISEEPWSYTRQFLADEEEPRVSQGSRRIDEIRREAMAAFTEFYYRLRDVNELTAEYISMAIYDLLLGLGVPETLSLWQEDCENRGDLISALEHAGVWDKTLEILEQAVEILGAQHCDIDTYALIINAGLEDIRLGAIPPSLDQVLIGSLDRTRQPECRATFLIGALEGDFPRKHGEEGVFTDKEREVLLKAGLSLEPSSRVKQLHEQYLVYVALTRPREALYISYPLGDDDGKAVFPSPVISWVKKTMPCKKIHFVSIDPPGTYPEDLDYVAPATVWGLAARRLSLLRQGIPPGVVWEETYRWMLDACRAPRSRRILGSLGFTNQVERLGEVLSHKLYGRPLVTSVSTLERFQQCPFQHFAGHGLKLKEREVFKLDPLKAGSFFHEAMREFVRKFAVREQEADHLGQQDAIEIMDQVVEELVPRIQNELFLSSFRYQHVSRALGSVLRRSALLFLEHATRSEFRPLAVEVPFGLPGGVTPYSVDVPGHGEVLMRGRIDRVDLARSGPCAYLRVVDYKSSRSNLDLLEVYYGLSLQLLVYLSVVLSKWDEIVKGPLALPRSWTGMPAGEKPRNGAREGLDALAATKLLPAGAVYLAIEDPFLKEDGPIDSDAAWLKRKKNLRMTGALVEDIDVLRLMDKTGSGHSDIVPVQFTKAGIGSSSQTVAESDLNVLLDYVMDKISRISADIISGRIDIAPFRRNQQRACTYCAFGPLCIFDVLVEGNAYNMLRNLSKEQIWEEIRSVSRGGK
ncbi:MAG TPA: hypothetical protein GX529_03025 [Firmicutes bacterium]|nr:hypothetical protein [Candidatus Fermentithermobacillaceae bacterium]